MEISTKRNRTRFKQKVNSQLLRVSVQKTNQYFFAQLIDVQNKGKIVAAIHEKTFAKTVKEKATPVERVGKMGEAFGKIVMEAGVSSIAYDRSGYIYHGKIKAFADGMRKAGLTL
jgi:large subunit ribosomal protein L18